ncbi:HAD-IIB family hydrolase [Mycetocola tolaasinivorans]|uniref:HAD-IIB family hydrolase n=1 Tax=Mycetocola tolaasinivorans TaxID=76635 RepID=UPI001FE97596|nr:HAD-IIB family hydrolase [Mycetocola tolaasinivorans]
MSAATEPANAEPITTLPVLLAFDLDDTLAPSKTRLPDEMARVFAQLLPRTQLAVISGGQIGQFRTQVIEALESAGATHLENLHLMPTCGTQYFRYSEGAWERRYVESLSDDEKARALAAVESSARELGLWSEETWGDVLEDRESQITFSALGQEAPVEAKYGWDPSGEKKERLREKVAALLPDLEVRAGGSTSIDITRRGRDKAYGVNRLLEATGLELGDILFYGDQLQPGGNDHAVAAMGARVVEVTGWPDTLARLQALPQD